MRQGPFFVYILLPPLLQIGRGAAPRPRLEGTAERKNRGIAEHGGGLSHSVSHEGGPLNRAPRTSILAEIYLLQCLSILLQEDFDLTAQKYVKFHPGGSLRKLRGHEIHP